MKVFFDTNVLLDVLRDRQPFVVPARQAWLLAERGQVTGLVSALSFSNIFYIVRRFADADTARRSLQQLRLNFTPVACDAGVVDRALAAEFADFEDALQYFSAVNAGADCLLTRDPAHFAAAAIPVLSPSQFLATFRPG